MRARFVRGNNVKKSLTLGVEEILWQADLSEGETDNVKFLDDDMNQNDPELIEMLNHFIKMGDKIRQQEGEDEEGSEMPKTLYRTELGFILTQNTDYGDVYFCHISSLPEIEERLGRPIKKDED